MYRPLLQHLPRGLPLWHVARKPRSTETENGRWGRPDGRKQQQHAEINVVLKACPWPLVANGLVRPRTVYQHALREGDLAKLCLGKAFGLGGGNHADFSFCKHVFLQECFSIMEYFCAVFLKNIYVC